ncbi:hypothetical protein ACLK18_13900 [Escherichia coli]
MSSCGQQAQTRGLKHLFVMADSFLHQAGMTAGLTRSLAVKGIAMTLWPCPVGEPCITDVCAAVAQLRESGAGWGDRIWRRLSAGCSKSRGVAGDEPR